MGDATEIGLNKKAELTIGAALVTRLAYLLPYRDLYDKRRCAVIPYPSSALKINGMQAFSLQILQDKDEISFNGEQIYFTYETRAQVVVFEPRDGEAAIFCARCKGIVQGEAVKCPGSCGLWYHESAKGRQQCWSYDAKCIACGHPTGRGLSWKPSPGTPSSRVRGERRVQK